jgi:hypothetical protein
LEESNREEASETEEKDRKEGRPRNGPNDDPPDGKGEIGPTPTSTLIPYGVSRDRRRQQAACSYFAAHSGSTPSRESTISEDGRDIDVEFGFGCGKGKGVGRSHIDTFGRRRSDGLLFSHADPITRDDTVKQDK